MIRGSWYRHGTDWVVVLTGQPQDAVHLGIGDTIAEAWASLDDTPIRGTGGESEALIWAASRGWIDRIDLEPANDAAVASVASPVGDVSWSGDTHSYVACLYGDDGEQPGDCYTRHGRDEVGLWWTDDGDDSVRQDVAGPHLTEDDAIAAAEELADRQDEGADGQAVRS